MFGHCDSHGHHCFDDYDTTRTFIDTIAANKPRHGHPFYHTHGMCMDVYHKHHHHHFHHKNPLSELNTGNSFFFQKEAIDGCSEFLFHPFNIYLFDKVIMENGFDGLSTEQRQFFQRYMFEAGLITDYLNGDCVDLPCHTSDMMMSFDKHLANAKDIMDAERIIDELWYVKRLEETKENTERIKALEAQLRELKIFQNHSDDIINDILANMVVVRD